jgi:hypothetical protein
MSGSKTQTCLDFLFSEPAEWFIMDHVLFTFAGKILMEVIGTPQSTWGKPGMVALTCNSITQEDSNFGASLGYIEKSRPAWAT